MKRLVLIDGHAILHRAFHAIPPNFHGPDETPTNAVYGFLTMLLRAIDNLKPDYLAVAFDLPAPNFRQQLYTQYQEKRPEMVGNLRDQIPLVFEMLEMLKIPHFEVAGFEADDCLGTLSFQAKEQGIETVIVTGDRDMLQLVNGAVKVCVPVKGLSETKTYDHRMIEEEFGVTPSQWVDVKALKGDGSDNYPGVRGIGPKTAQNLITKFGTLEKVYEHLGELDKKVATKLAEGAESAGMGKQLAKIVTDVPTVKLDLETAGVGQIDWKTGTQFMTDKLGFKTIVEKIRKQYFGEEIRTEKAKKTEEQISLL